jgi:hypothetical protein
MCPGKEPQISPLRCATVEMTKGRVVMDRSSGLRTRKPQIVTSLRFRRDEKRLLSSNFSFWRRPSTVCHLDRSVPGFPTSRCPRRPSVRLSVRRAACRPSTPRVFTGNPWERSGEISVWMRFLGNVFRGVEGPAHGLLNSGANGPVATGQISDDKPVAKYSPEQHDRGQRESRRVGTSAANQHSGQ